MRSFPLSGGNPTIDLDPERWVDVGPKRPICECGKRILTLRRYLLARKRIWARWRHGSKGILDQNAGVRSATDRQCLQTAEVRTCSAHEHGVKSERGSTAMESIVARTSSGNIEIVARAFRKLFSAWT